MGKLCATNLIGKGLGVSKNKSNIIVKYHFAYIRLAKKFFYYNNQC